jgi:hypothetical protein
MSLPSDPVDVLKWAGRHSGDAWWVIVAIGAGIAWTNKRLRDWNRRNSVLAGSKPAADSGAVQWATDPTPKTPQPPKPPQRPRAPTPPAAAASYTAAPSYAAAGYTAQPAYAAPVAAAPQHAPARKLHREGAPAQRAAAPVARSVDVPAAASAHARILGGALGDPAHARASIVIAEVLGPPVALR